MEYSRNLIFVVGGRMEQVFQALIDRSRAPLDLTMIKTILGDKGRPKYRPRNMRAAEWEVAVERPTYDLTVFKLHCGKVTLKIYSKGERVLRIEAVAQNIREFHCGRLLHNFPEIVRRLRGMLERFMEALSCIDQCFIGDEMLERLPLPSRVGKSMVGRRGLLRWAKPRRARAGEPPRRPRRRGRGSGRRRRLGPAVRPVGDVGAIPACRLSRGSLLRFDRPDCLGRRSSHR